MLEITITSEGMMCGHCEAHMNDAIKAAFDVKKVTSDHDTGKTVILTEQDITNEALQAAVAPTGYKFLGVERAERERGGLFGFMKN